MSWVRLDDLFPEHPKVREIGAEAFALHVAAICYSNRHLTDGYVSSTSIPLLFSLPDPVRTASDLVTAGLWEKRKNGYQIHDYLLYQPSKETVTCAREKTRERVERWRKRKSNAVSNAPGNADVQLPQTQTQVVTSPNGDVSTSLSTAPAKEQQQSEAVKRLYDHWRSARSKTDRRYDRVSPARRSKIVARLREFSEDELHRAIDAVALDPWEERPRNDDLVKLFRSREHVDRWLELEKQSDPKDRQRRELAEALRYEEEARKEWN